MSVRTGAIALTSCLLAACATTRISTLSRDFPAAAGYRKILVVIPAQNVDVRNQLEEEFSSGLSGGKVEAVPSLTILAPAIDPGSGEAAPILRDNAIDAVLSLKRLTPYQEPLTAVGGKSKPRLRYELDLFDSRSGRVVWTAESFTEGQLLATLGTMQRSLLHRTRKALKEEKLTPL